MQSQEKFSTPGYGVNLLSVMLSLDTISNQPSIISSIQPGVKDTSMPAFYCLIYIKIFYTFTCMFHSQFDTWSNQVLK
jgi:hypothetical protein